MVAALPKYCAVEKDEKDAFHLDWQQRSDI